MLTLFLFLGFFFDQAYGLQFTDCPMANYELAYPGRREEAGERVFNVTDWGTCAKHCYLNSNCIAWLWWHSEKATWALQCRIYIEQSGLKIVEHRNDYTTLGSRDCQDIECEVQEIANGQIVQNSNGYLEHIMYICDDGYELEGDDTLQCLFDGWSAPAPTCEDINECEQENECSSYADCNNTDGGYDCICIEGYEGNGNSCSMITCEELDNPANGQITADGFTYGETISYGCNDGYVLQGDEYRICSSNGWTGDAPVCELKDCGVPESIANGTFSTTSGTTFNHAVFYQCDSGYEMLDDDTRTCTMSGWSGYPPECINIDECSGDHDCSSNAMCIDEEGSYECYCNIGYNGDGFACEPVPCGDPASIGRWGTRTGSEFTYGKFVNYACVNDEYELFDGETRVCNEYGEWSSTEEPYCDVIMYELEVKTSNNNWAGTDDSIFVMIHGPISDCGRFLLDTKSDDNERNNIETYKFRCPTMGTVSGITLDHTGSDGWRPSYIKVKKIVGGETVTCTINSSFENVDLYVSCS